MIELKIIVFIFGGLVGSFLNVVIYRMPKGLSVVTPRSSCPKCGHMIKWYENLPVVSYLFLRGKCSNCSVKISIRYPLIELLVACFAVFLFPPYLTPDDILISVYLFSVACIFLAHFIIDIEHQILPDKINIYFLAITVPFAMYTTPLYFWLYGGLIGFLGPFGITWLFYKLRGQIGLGGGDIKLFGILGLILGPMGILNNIFMSCMLGSIIGLTLIVSKRMNRNTPLAFGPYIIIAAAVQIFFPQWFEMINPFSF